MDIETLVTAVAVAKKIPGSAIARAEAAQTLAESAAQNAAESAAQAATHNYGLSISNHALVITSPVGGA